MLVVRKAGTFFFFGFFFLLPPPSLRTRQARKKNAIYYYTFAFKITTFLNPIVKLYGGFFFPFFFGFCPPLLMYMYICNSHLILLMYCTPVHTIPPDLKISCLAANTHMLGSIGIIM